MTGEQKLEYNNNDNNQYANLNQCNIIQYSNVAQHNVP